MAILLLQEKADADGSDPLSQVDRISESFYMCLVADDFCFEQALSLADEGMTLLSSSAYTAVHSSGSLRTSNIRRGLPNSQGGRDQMVKYLFPDYSARITSWALRYFNIWQREVRFYICLRNLRI